jgi:hypothetical protein
MVLNQKLDLGKIIKVIMLRTDNFAAQNIVSHKKHKWG